MYYFTKLLPWTEVNNKPSKWHSTSQNDNVFYMATTWNVNIFTNGKADDGNRLGTEFDTFLRACFWSWDGYL